MSGVRFVGVIKAGVDALCSLCDPAKVKSINALSNLSLGEIMVPLHL